MIDLLTKSIWQWAFWCIVFLYALIYSPYGLNDTDGGFITGLAWEVLHGKILYKDLSYVRPPVPVWLRALELATLPDHLEIRAERWLFYLKMAITAACTARLFATGTMRWQLALITFLFSVHSYPPTAWHTVDGVFFAAIALYLIQLHRNWAVPLAVFAALLSELSKQVFIITPLVLAAWLLFSGRYRQLVLAVVYYAFGKFLFLALLQYQGALPLYHQMTTGATNAAAFWRHGLYDFFDMPWLFWILLAAFVFFQVLDYYKHSLPATNFYKHLLYPGKRALTVTIIAVLAISLIVQTYHRQAFTAPFSQMRLLWWIGLATFMTLIIRNRNRQVVLALGACSAINWASAVSWGYNLPVFLPVAGVYGLLNLTLNPSQVQRPLSSGLRITVLLITGSLLFTFHYGYQFIYRDGKRAEMHYHLGEIYPKLTGIYSDSDTYLKYRSLKELLTKYPDATVLPTMTLANYLHNRQGKLPLQWVVQREFGFSSWEPWLEQSRGQVFLIEKDMLKAIRENEQYAFVRAMVEDEEVIEDGEFFGVVKYN